MEEDGTNIRSVVKGRCVCVCVCVCVSGGVWWQHIICVLFLISTQRKRKQTCVCAALWAQQRAGGFTESEWAHFDTFPSPLNHTLRLCGPPLMTLPPTLLLSLLNLLTVFVECSRYQPTLQLDRFSLITSHAFWITFESVSRSVIFSPCLVVWNSKDNCLIKWYSHKCEWALNNRVFVVPAITYSNNKVQAGEQGVKKEGGGCVCVCEIVPQGSRSRARESREKVRE